MREAFVACRLHHMRGPRSILALRRASSDSSTKQAKRREALRLGSEQAEKKGARAGENDDAEDPLSMLGAEGLFSEGRSDDLESPAWPRAVPSTPGQIVDAKGPRVGLFLALVAAAWLYMGQFIGFQNSVGLIGALAIIFVLNLLLGKLWGEGADPLAPGNSWLNLQALSVFGAIGACWLTFYSLLYGYVRDALLGIGAAGIGTT